MAKVGERASEEWRAGWVEGFEALRRRLIAEAVFKKDFARAQVLMGMVCEAPHVVTGYEDG